MSRVKANIITKRMDPRAGQIYQPERSGQGPGIWLWYAFHDKKKSVSGSGISAGKEPGIMKKVLILCIPPTTSLKIIYYVHSKARRRNSPLALALFWRRVPDL